MRPAGSRPSGESLCWSGRQRRRTCSRAAFRAPHPGDTARPAAPGEVKRPALQPWLPRTKQVGPTLTLECLLGESLPAASCLEACLLPLLPAMVESRAWAGTCHKGSAGRQETDTSAVRGDSGPGLSAPEESGPKNGPTPLPACLPSSSGTVTPSNDVLGNNNTR